MTDHRSRHAGHPTYRRRLAGTEREVELFEPRFPTAPVVARHHTAERSDRLDLLAYRYLDDPHQFWLIADANPEVGLDALLEPGNAVKIPRPPA